MLVKRTKLHKEKVAGALQVYLVFSSLVDFTETARKISSSESRGLKIAARDQIGMTLRNSERRLDAEIRVCSKSVPSGISGGTK